MNKPSNWYQMSWEEQKEWKKQERARQDLEYEADQARQDAENARADYNQAHRNAQAEREAWGWQYAELQSRIAKLEEALRKIDAYYTDKDHPGAFFIDSSHPQNIARKVLDPDKWKYLP